MRVAVTGATGFVGRRLCQVLVARGVQVVAFSRDPARARRHSPEVSHFVAWDPGAAIAPAGALEGFDAVVSLAGESIGVVRWTPERRQRIRDSRVLGTRHLVESLARVVAKPRVLVSGSAVGYYGDRGDERLDESSGPGSGFLASVCVGWEDEARTAEGLGLRVVRLRTGLVFGPGGGMLGSLLPPFRLGAGGRLGSGRQWMSWVHLEDEVALILHALERDEVSGSINATAPEPVTNADFTRAMGATLHRPAPFVVPELALRMTLGDASEMVLGSQRVYPTRALATGYRFVYPELRPALESCLRRP